MQNAKDSKAGYRHPRAAAVPSRPLRFWGEDVVGVPCRPQLGFQRTYGDAKQLS